MDGEPKANEVVDFFDAFCGIGALRLGFERAGGGRLRCVGSADIDEPAIRVYQARFGEPDFHVMHRDIRQVNGTNQLPFRLFLGGFPCQSFSSVGDRMGFMDQTKGTLFFECARLIDEFKPACFLLENVKGLTTHDDGRTFATVIRTLGELGYVVQWQIINARYFVPQDRERIYIAGYLPTGRNCRLEPIFPVGIQEIKAFRARLDKEELQRQSELRRNERNSKSNKNAVAFDNKQEGFFGNRHVRRAGEPTATLITDEGTGFIQGGRARYATEIERERLMGLPDDWTMVPGGTGNLRKQRIRQTGNAVVTPVIQLIAERMMPFLTS